ncbi:F-box-like domain-containing protein [Pochonia chlamydosporia 170]|uniref:F-box-like domain-containing protein n=1 Tax=Pochonia chlamydosporia 170 TaxID=1380566 RepID=A0A179EY16_METCM|nr:F-box-like domain-containing protein [Pochonia chlamydosporia 170]OAQ58074.1 F-box-like domain-containing protein [Pochonia chlamydosporia 170]
MDVFSRLPPEMLDMVLKNLMARDLASMSLVCKSIRSMVTRRLWKFLAIRTKDPSYKYYIPDPAYPSEALEHVLHLHFRSDWEQFLKNNIENNRCIHEQRRRNIMTGADIEDVDPPDSLDHGSTTEDEECGKLITGIHSDWRFKFLGQRAKEILATIESGQLQSFAWDFGVCVPDDLLGTDGEITKNQRSIRSLSLITDCYCQCLGDESSKVNFTKFENLRGLRWKAPRVNDLASIFEAIRANAGRLESLELDFVSWRYMEGILCLYLGKRDSLDMELEKYFTAHLTSAIPDSGSRFQSLRNLSLSHIPLTAAAGEVFNFDTLRSITLRDCPGWSAFLHVGLKPGDLLHLTTLEVKQIEMDWASGLVGWRADLGDILGRIKGLEELFVCFPRDHPDVDIWSGIARHKATLRRLSVHSRIGSEREGFFDDMYLGILDHEYCDLDQNPQSPAHPLAGLALECLGLSCSPDYFKILLSPLLSSPIQVIHIRQSLSTYHAHSLWPVHRTDSNRPLSDDLRLFANWAFGPEGLKSLKVIFFGDASFGATVQDQVVILQRDETMPHAYRAIRDYKGRSALRSHEFLRRFCDFLEACPSKAFFEA